MKKNILFIVLGLLMLGAVVYGLYASYQNNQVGQKIKKDLLIPYIEHLNKKDYRKAYNDFTSVYYKKQYHVDDFLVAQTVNATKLGEKKEYQETSGIFSLIKEPGSPDYYRTTFQLRGEKNFDLVTFDVVSENGNYKIYRTYEAILGKGLRLVEKIY